jgi:hypothetical protein
MRPKCPRWLTDNQGSCPAANRRRDRAGADGYNEKRLGSDGDFADDTFASHASFSVSPGRILDCLRTHDWLGLRPGAWIQAFRKYLPTTERESVLASAATRHEPSGKPKYLSDDGTTSTSAAAAADRTVEPAWPSWPPSKSGPADPAGYPGPADRRNDPRNRPCLDLHELFALLSNAIGAGWPLPKGRLPSGSAVSPKLAHAQRRHGSRALLPSDPIADPVTE